MFKQGRYFVSTMKGIGQPSGTPALGPVDYTTQNVWTMSWATFGTRLEYVWGILRGHLVSWQCFGIGACVGACSNDNLATLGHV